MTDITLDWDIKFEDVQNSVSWGVLRRFCVANRGFIDSVAYRRSSSGNTHVKIKIMDAVYMDWVHVLEVRAFLRDDPYRIKLDLVRIFVDNPIGFDLSQWKLGGAGGTDRLWDWKIKGGVAYDAGEWLSVVF
jgi:hypothetical protein